jgi:hypothetical protein
VVQLAAGADGQEVLPSNGSREQQANKDEQQKIMPDA